MTSKRNLVTHLEQVRRTFRPEFKLEAVRQFELNNKPPAQLAHELGIHLSMLFEWRRKKLRGKLCLPTDRPLTAELSELKYLRRKLTRVTKERDVLKKAISYFASLAR